MKSDEYCRRRGSCYNNRTENVQMTDNTITNNTEKINDSLA